MASLTIALPASKSMSAGMDLSSPPDERPTDTMSPGRSSVPGTFTHLTAKVFAHVKFYFLP